MEGFGGLGFDNKSSAARKKRSIASRRPRNDAQQYLDFLDISSLSSTPPSDNNMMNNEDGGFGESDEASNNGSFQSRNDQRCSEGGLAPANSKFTNKLGQSVSDSSGYENKVKKVKLKVGGVTHTINAKSTLDDSSSLGSSAKSSRVSDAPRPRQKFIVLDNSDDNPSSASDKGSGLQGLEWRDVSKSALPVAKGDMLRGRMSHKSISIKQLEKYEPVHKSMYVSKRRMPDRVLDDESDDDDDEIRYLEKVKILKVTANYGANFEDDERGGSRKQRKISKVLKRNADGQSDADIGDYGSLRSGKCSKKSKSGTVSDDTDYLEEEEPMSDDEPDSKKQARKEFVDLLVDHKKEMTVTTRQRALQAGKDISAKAGASIIEFPNGLPPAPPRKPKEKLSEVEQQLKKSEAAQRRRMQVEKAARESEAEAIRKILGQDSTRKKREAKMKKRQEELAEEKAANAKMLTSDTVRWVMGPSGTVVTFPMEVGLPSIFDAKPCSYPPPREKCAGPSCTNPYKYRDSKSKLPLCSLQCYKAIQEKMPPVTAC